MSITDTTGEARLAMIETGFPRRLDPNRVRVRATSHAWLREQRLMPSDRTRELAESLRYADLIIAGCFVGGAEPVLSAITDFSCWFLVWGGQHDRDITRRRERAWSCRSDELRAALEAPDTRRSHSDPMAAGFADSVCRLYSCLGDRWNARFADHFHGVIDADAREFRNRMTRTVPPLAEYLELRRHTHPAGSSRVRRPPKPTSAATGSPPTPLSSTVHTSRAAGTATSPNPAGSTPTDDGPASPARSAFVPFGGGARRCVGDTFATTATALDRGVHRRSWRLHTAHCPC